MVGIEASTREGNPRRRNNQCERLGRVAEHFTRTLGHNCRALHETSPPLEPVDATSADVFSVLSASSSNPRASIVPPSLPPSSTEIFSLSSPIVCFPLQVKPAIFPFFPFSLFTLLTPRKRNTRLAAESADFARSEISPTFRASEEIRSTYKRMYDVYIV